MQLMKLFILDKWKSWRKYFALLGGIFVYLPIGVPWYFGNLATYIDSYFYARVEREEDLINQQWIFSAFLVLFTLAVPGSGYMVQWVGVRVTVFVALVIHSGATYLSYFAMQHSMHLLVAVFGAVGGLGAGLAYGTPLPVVIKWMPKQVGLATGALVTGFGGGAIFYNELITAFVNPENIKPDVIGIKTTFFSQPEILRRVPQLFLVLGTLTVGIQMVGVMLLRMPRDDEMTDSTELVEQNSNKLKFTTTESCVLCQYGTNEGQELKRLCQHQLQEQRNMSEATTSYQAIDSGDVIQLDSNTVDDVTPDTPPRQLLTNVHFYILWTALAANHYGYIIKNNFYKEFGQSEIRDDHFLTMTGTISTLAVAVARLVWGKMADCLGVKTTLIVFMASTTISTAIWYPCVFQHPVIYMVIVTVIAFVLSGAFIIFPLAALKMFGETHYSTNYGLILSAQIVVNLISPPINTALMNLSWFWLLISIAVVNAIGTVLSLFLKDSK